MEGLCHVTNVTGLKRRNNGKESEDNGVEDGQLKSQPQFVNR